MPQPLRMVLARAVDRAGPTVIEVDQFYPHPDDDVQQRSRTIMGNGWIRIAAQLGEVLGS